MTQDELAELAGVTVKYIQRLERGENLSIRSLVWWANLFEIDVIAFFRGRGSPDRSPGRPRRIARPRR